jgi:hypothetical protein
MPWQDGLWLGRMTDEQKAHGGLWTHGDKPFDPDPEYPGRNDGSLLVKLWTAYPEKYGGEGYQPKDRIHEDRWEYVRVLENCLICRVHLSTGIKNWPLTAVGDGIDLPPSIKRSWHLPPEYPYASGIAAIRRLRRSDQPLPEEDFPLKPGQGPGYELAMWDAGVNPDVLVQGPYNLPHWRLLFIAVLDGMLDLLRTDKPGYARDPGNYVFIRREEYNEWHFEFRDWSGRGIALYTT